MHVERALAKLTRTLRITGVRADGYHTVDAEMVTVDLADMLTFAPGDSLTITGAAAAGVPTDESNLICRALAAIGRTAAVTVDKHIPTGAGLGGGSADAAAVLRWAGCTDIAVAVGLGADVPFCLAGGRARVTGIGDVLDPLADDDATYTLLTPPFGCDTAAVYAAWDALGGPTAAGPNDLERAALQVQPRLAEWRDRLGDATGATPCLAGSGSTWFVQGAYPDVPGGVVVRTARP